MSDDQSPVWDDAFALKLLGRALLVGMTYEDTEGDCIEQLHGEVVSVDPKQGVCIRLAGKRTGEFFWLPPDLRSVSLARPGSYRLRSTGEIVEDPDYTAAWIVQPKRT